VRWKNSYEGLDALVAERGSALLDGDGPPCRGPAGALNRDAIDADRNGRMAFWPACMERTWLVTNVDSGWTASAFSAVVECRS
jgi:hypothetical protein